MVAKEYNTQAKARTKANVKVQTIVPGIILNKNPDIRAFLTIGKVSEIAGHY